MSITVSPQAVPVPTQAQPQNPGRLDTSEQVPQTPAPEAQAPKREAITPDMRSHLARKERALFEQRRAIEQERKALEAHRAEIEQARAWKERLTKDPYQVMLEAGLTSDQATALMLNQPNPQDQNLQLLQSELKRTRDELEAMKTGQSTAADQQREAAKKQIFHDVTQLVDAEPDKFETLKFYGDSAKQTVVELIEQVFDQQGYIMDTDQAIQEVEEYLFEEALKTANLKKIKAKLTPTQVAAQSEQAQPQTQKPTISTLSNRLAPTAKRLTEKERRERAILAYQGKLNT